MNKAEDIEQLIYRELAPDRYCYIHNFILEKDKEIERLNNIIKEVKRLIEQRIDRVEDLAWVEMKREDYIDEQQELLEILDKGE